MIPSGKLISLAIVSLSIIGFAFYYAEVKNGEETPVYTATVNNATDLNLLAGSSDSYKDSDGDGLKDWEETLWGTDPRVSDADKAKEAPVVAKAKKTAPLTATDSLGRNLFTQFMNLKQVGLTSDAPSLERAAATIVESGFESNEGPRVYSSSDIKSSANIQVKDYINAVGGIIRNRTPKITKSEITIFREALEAKDMSLVKQLDPASTAYKLMLTDLLQLTVPQTTVDLHVRLLNNIATIGYVVDAFRQAPTDPAASIKGLALFQPTFENTVSIFREYGTIISSQRITYQTDEGGYFFVPKKPNAPSI